MFGISGGELAVILLVAALVLGPRSLAQALVGLRKVVEGARQCSARLRSKNTLDVSSLGFSAADLEALRQINGGELDPRRIVQEAMREEMRAWLDAGTRGSQNPAEEPKSNREIQRSPSTFLFSS